MEDRIKSVLKVIYSLPNPTNEQWNIEKYVKNTPGYLHKMYMVHENAITPEEIKIVTWNPSFSHDESFKESYRTKENPLWGHRNEIFVPLNRLVSSVKIVKFGIEKIMSCIRSLRKSEAIVVLVCCTRSGEKELSISEFRIWTKRPIRVELP